MLIKDVEEVQNVNDFKKKALDYWNGIESTVDGESQFMTRANNVIIQKRSKIDLNRVIAKTPRQYPQLYNIGLINNESL